MKNAISSLSTGMRILLVALSVLLVGSLVTGGILLSNNISLNRQSGDLETELADAAAQNESLRAELDAALAEPAALDVLQAEYDAYQTEAQNDLAAAVAAGEADVQAAKDEAAQALDALAQELETYKADSQAALDALTDEFTAYKADSAMAVANASAVGIANLQAAQDEATQALADLQGEFDAYKTETDKTYAALADEFTAYKAETAQEETAQALAALQQEFDTYKADSDAAYAALAAEYEEYKAAGDADTLAELQAEYDALSTEYAEYQASSALAIANASSAGITALEAAKEEAAQALSDLQTELDDYKAGAEAALASGEADLAALQEEFDVSKAAAETALANLTDEFETFKASSALALANASAQAQADNEASAQALSDLQAAFDAYQAEAEAAYTALTDTYEAYQAEADAALAAAVAAGEADVAAAIAEGEADVAAAVAAGEADLATAQDAAAQELNALQADFTAHQAEAELTEAALFQAKKQLAVASIPRDENGAGNHSGGMLAQLYNGDILYSNFYDTGNIYAENAVGLGDALLRNISSDESNPLYNIVGTYGDWLYYRHSGCFFRYNKSTGANEMLIHSYKQPPSSGLQAIGETLYFLGLPVNGDGELADNLWSMELNGAYLTRIPGVKAASFACGDMYLYYASLDRQALVKLDPADNSETVLIENADVDYLNAVDGVLYFTLNGQLTKMDPDGTEPVALGGGAAYVNVLGNWIYYVNTEDSGTLYRITTDGMYPEQICDVENSAYVNIAGDWVYFMQLTDPDDTAAFIKACKVRLDGSGLVLSQP